MDQSWAVLMSVVCVLQNNFSPSINYQHGREERRESLRLAVNSRTEKRGRKGALEWTRCLPFWVTKDGWLAFTRPSPLRVINLNFMNLCVSSGGIKNSLKDGWKAGTLTIITMRLWVKRKALFVISIIRNRLPRAVNYYLLTHSLLSPVPAKPSVTKVLTEIDDSQIWNWINFSTIERDWNSFAINCRVLNP